MKRIAILGSTGSIGTQALEVVRQHKDKFEVEVLTASNNVDLLISQAIEFQPNAVVIENELHYEKIKNLLSSYDVKVYCGEKAIEQIVESNTIDMVLVAIVGFAALRPTLNAIKHRKKIAIANKETFVVAGEIMVEEVERNRVMMIPVDSEHSAIYQCLVGENLNTVEKLILTASGGPFRGKDMEFLKTVTPEQALKHPNWNMGAKITIDSATLMNKGLEVIEAHWLFGLKASQIDVVVHHQSIIHSMVMFTDGSMKAQMGLPDMKLPIQYAMAFPERIPNDFQRFDFAQYPMLTFEQADVNKFRNLATAYRALEKGGNAPCIINAANEVAVDAFLKKQISFIEISNMIENALEKVDFIKKPSLDDYFETDKITRVKTLETIRK